MNMKKNEQAKPVRLTREQIERASSSLVVDAKEHFSNVDKPLYQIMHLLTQLQDHPFMFDDGTVDDAVYAAINQHAENSLCRAERGLKAVADMLEVIGCADGADNQGLSQRQTLNLSGLLEIVADNFEAMRELAEGTDRTLAVRNIARIQIASKTQRHAE